MIDDEIREVAERIVNKLFEDVVEVVRCKDCKYWDKSDMRMDDKCECKRLWDEHTCADDFCSRGEKR